MTHIKKFWNCLVEISDLIHHYKYQKHRGLY